MAIDLLIIGGGMGGCAAALSACSQGLKVVMTEETDWIGGQVTAQGVPPDEHPWIEEAGCTESYRMYREKVRQYYQDHFLIKGATDQLFNPGKGLVSKICHDPRVSLHVLYDMLGPYLLTNQLTILPHTIIKNVTMQQRELKHVTIQHLHTHHEHTLKARYYIDATEAGDVLPLAEIPYVTGAEAKDDTKEDHAREKTDPRDIQAFTSVLAMEYRPGEEHIIEEPAMYTFFRDYQPHFWPDKMLSFYAPHPITHEKREYDLFPGGAGFPLWTYRRIFAAEQFPRSKSFDVSLMNWPQNDYLLGNIYDVSEDEKTKHLYQSKQLSLSLFYYLQTEAIRPDGGIGYPGLMLRSDVFQTKDGCAKAPYIRESRRIHAEYRITEHDVSPAYHKGGTGKCHEDRIGIGSYSIDLHPSLSGQNYLDIPALPFHIPLGALIPQQVDNLLAGCKNIGTTHITNGCFRLHPVEWNIGEAAGMLVAFCLQQKKQPTEVRNSAVLLREFQLLLRKKGFELEWPDHFYNERLEKDNAETSQ
ncbi:FAD-dependent oxidoreductase [Priestia koreensis]|uniref:FAD-dependent oxidoreductase n=1 Tax=Priestia koreensis TaxID=284581 RepID=UPI001F567F07|nr:FAD-dependent oxidoreductase [Priestia koreensis]UNL86281.1 FAD-dependent oxidoreductase [Priestia koreensis]